MGCQFPFRFRNHSSIPSSVSSPGHCPTTKSIQVFPGGSGRGGGDFTKIASRAARTSSGVRLMMRAIGSGFVPDADGGSRGVVVAT